MVVTRDYRFADAVQAHCGGADVIVDGLGAAGVDENIAAAATRCHWISLGRRAARCRRWSPIACWPSRCASRAPWCSTSSPRSGNCSSAPTASGRRWPTACCASPPSSASPRVGGPGARAAGVA
ncbi:hypothetical protein HK414_28160 [Ramlibacter terrae]|uniref:Alcohol dehydrogenase-like C-terminal domain-containing protein n=1 Tax=Ramlibacter terrae TaxID=2732511 RepID=A0ABX6P0M5_9BURK|nr:hypothetical protein HK414_28160 [Ramlibacter terrae]